MHEYIKSDITEPEDLNTKSRYSKKQLIVLVAFIICYCLTAILIVSNQALPALLFFILHSIGFLVFYYMDAIHISEEMAIEYWLAKQSIDNTSDTPKQIITTPEPESDPLAQELLHSLSEKCSEQAEELMKLKNELLTYTEKNILAKASIEKLEQRQLQESMIPSSHMQHEHKPVDMITIVNTVLTELHSDTVKAGIQVQVSSSTDTIMVKADAVRIRTLFRNIIDNSIKYMQKQGSLIITLSTIGDDIFIVCKDNGNGLHVLETEHVFELNYQGSNRISGNGLGLAQAKAIVTSYGGTIYAKSTLGKGMGIYIQLPATHGDNHHETT